MVGRHHFQRFPDSLSFFLLREGRFRLPGGVGARGGEKFFQKREVAAALDFFLRREPLRLSPGDDAEPAAEMRWVIQLR